MFDMTHLYVWHDSFVCVTWLIGICDMTQLYAWHVSFVCVTWPVHMRDMTRSYVDVTLSYVWRASLICVTWPFHVCDMNYSSVTWHVKYIYTCIYIYTRIYIYYAWHDSVISVTQLLYTCQWRHYGVTTISRLLKIVGLLCKRALSKRLYSVKETYNLKEPTRINDDTMGWLRLVGSLKL